MRRTALVFAAVAMACCSGGPDLGLYDPDRWDSLDELLPARRELRAYDGAPPTIPHEVAERGRENCNSCHTPGVATNSDRVGPPRSHPTWGDCRQCHVETNFRKAFVRSQLDPLWWPARGSRLYPTAPPTIPHYVQYRQNCAVCHIGDQAPAALRAAHGMRENCQQCHVEAR